MEAAFWVCRKSEKTPSRRDAQKGLNVAILALPLRANIDDFQWPQAILDFDGNWLIPKSKITRVIRCPEAGIIEPLRSVWFV